MWGARYFQPLQKPRTLPPDPNLSLTLCFLPRRAQMASDKEKPHIFIPIRWTNCISSSILHATEIWASVSPFTFSYTPDYDQADIKISFQYRDHGDGNSFDGPKGILAHAFAPSDGRLHFDGDEKWVDGVTPGAFDLQTVGLHELGHVLGLGHTNDSGAVMYPYIGDGLRKVLGQDDIDGIKALYQF
ncbi:Metalloendoproteinase 1 [Sesamum angolense]|uniref:Metalloendoproteinase 1 n=1 Tax=Sesamum angolense TaxID=2727404 RepID=A0AAE2BS37_9LAMI|nr:Metalloendoproteinase 1 [Sesamum angolense]